MMLNRLTQLFEMGAAWLTKGKIGEEKLWMKKRSRAAITLLLLVSATYVWVLFFVHIPFVVNRAFSAMPAEKLQQN